jgi:hypothetical protein
MVGCSERSRREGLRNRVRVGAPLPQAGGRRYAPHRRDGGSWVRFRFHGGQDRITKITMVARTKAQNFPVRESARLTAMEESDAEQKATTRIATEARNVGSVLISKTIFMAERGRSKSLEQRG